MISPLLASIALLSLAAVPTGTGIDLSPDDSSYAATLGEPVIHSALLVPGGTLSGAFYLRNSLPVPAYLELELANPHWTDADYASAILVRAEVQGVTSRSLPLNTDSVCPAFVSGVLLAAGESVRITTSVSLGDLDGTIGQDASASLDLVATLTEAVGGAPGSPCAPPASTPGERSTTTVTVLPAEALPTEALPAPGVAGPAGVPTTQPGSDVGANTGYDFDGSPLWWALAATAIGVVLFLLLAGRRRAREESHE